MVDMLHLIEVFIGMLISFWNLVDVLMIVFFLGVVQLREGDHQEPASPNHRGEKGHSDGAQYTSKQQRLLWCIILHEAIGTALSVFEIGLLSQYQKVKTQQEIDWPLEDSLHSSEGQQLSIQQLNDYAFFCICQVNSDVSYKLMSSKLIFPRISNYFEENLSLSQFQLIKILGKGSFGQVILYRHRPTNREYAIKKIQLNKSQKISRQELQSMTKKEIQILYKLENPHIIRLLDHFQDQNSVYLITEFVEGMNLYDITLKKGVKLSQPEIAEIIYQTCEGLEELHNNHILHRDIKLENLMYNNSQIKIVDLGCSNFFGASIARKTTIGTRLYYSPEILLQEEQNDKLDVWCLGVVLYELLFLQGPFGQPDIEKKIRKIQYTFPDNVMVEPDLKDLFKNIFTQKANRYKASDVKKHPWVLKYCKDRKSKKLKFQDYFIEYQVQNYREMIEDHIKKQEEFLSQLKSQGQMLESMLKEANRQLREMRIKQA